MVWFAAIDGADIALNPNMVSCVYEDEYYDSNDCEVRRATQIRLGDISVMVHDDVEAVIRRLEEAQNDD